LAGAKLSIYQISDVVHKYQELIDFVVEYYPIGEKNTRPKAIVKIGYSRNLSSPPTELIKEVEREILEINQPVQYETRMTQMAILEFQLVPEDELVKIMYSRPGKPQRVIIKE